MTPSEFATLAEQIAGPRWRTRLGPLIGRQREQVRRYAVGKVEIPVVVQIAMRALAKSRQTGK